ncbi:MAG: PilX N-terminal domain-containing pilus assembly protein [Psychrobium sp.]
MRSFFKSQRGAVLVVSLVILLVMTLISTSELSNAHNQTRMVNNAQQANLTFNSAESALIQALESIAAPSPESTNNIDAMNNSTAGSVATNIVINAFNVEGLTIKLTYQSTPKNTLRPGVSLDASNDDNIIRDVNFELTSTATIDSSGANATLIRGFTYE